MLLTLQQFHERAEIAATRPKYRCAVDFETTGLFARKGARAFILGFTDETGNYSVLLEGMPPELMARFFSNTTAKYAAHNAKFEMAFLREQWGVDILGDVWDTEVFARVEHNNHRRYNLQSCSERIGRTKNEAMTQWLKKEKKMHWEAPIEMVVPYVEEDAELSYVLMNRQIAIFMDWEKNSAVPIAQVIRLEMDTTKALFEMECHGLNLHVSYSEEALAYELQRAVDAKTLFESLAKEQFKDSGKTLSKIFDKLNLQYGKTELGNPSFTAEKLAGLANNEVVKALLAHRTAVKRSSSYWKNFLELHHHGKIHPGIRQTGAETFRMSIAEPSAQNWPDDSEDPDCQYPIRRAFIPDVGCAIVSLDYKQMELRLMADEAGEMQMITDIRAGVDFHVRVAEAAGTRRGVAKNGRFAKSYGAGVPRLAATLGVSMAVAQKVSDMIDEDSPNIAKWSWNLIRYAKSAPFGYNWLGRRYHFDRGFAYKYPNSRVQGGCAEILRFAICEVTDFLKSAAKGNTYLMLPIHDELVLNVDPVDRGLLPEVKRLMVGAHKAKKHLEMDVSAASGPNFHDLEEIEI